MATIQTPNSSIKNFRVAAASIVIASAALVASHKREEGVRYVPYWDIVGVRTVCVGSTRAVEERRYSDSECNARLSEEIRTHNPLTCIRVPIAQTEYEAYADLAFNIGLKQFCQSTLVRILNEGDYAGACKQILRWVKQAELKPRRERAYKKCITPVDEKKEVPNVTLRVATESEDLGPLVLKPTRDFWSWFLGRKGVGAGSGS